jgi:phosphinothricin acetyltransferase
MNISLRIATPADAAAIAAIYAPYVLDTAITFETEVPNVAEIERRVATIGRQYPWLSAIDEGGQVLGYAYACEHRTRRAYRWSVDVGIYLDARAHRRGIGHRLYEALFALLLWQGYYNAYAGITLPNQASIGLHEALGFERVGVYRRVGHKLGAWRDVGWWELLLRESASEPGEPLAFSELPTSEVDELLSAT